MMLLLCASLALSGLPFLATADATTYSVQCLGSSDRPACTLSEGATPEADVTGRFYDEINATGWSRLFVRAPSIKPTTGFAAGYLEGALTANRIAQHLSNHKASNNLENLAPNLQAFVEGTDAWMRAEILAAEPNDQYWSTVRFIYEQLDGMLVGANDHLASDQQLTRLDVLLLGLIGDLADIKMAVDEKARVNFANMTGSQISLWAQRHGHCSALVKLVPDGSELFVGHNMWWSYSGMLRTFKHYEFGSLPAIAMSSFPGVLASADDFYQVGSLVVMETTTTVYNHELLAAASSRALPYWIRAMTANYMAKTGPEWMNIFKKYNSGTYNNMWMVVDYSKFSPGLPLASGLFTVGEQLPGYFHFEDQTHVLSYGYWPSYNVALYPKTRTLSGQEQIELQHPQLSYQQNPRAQVFRRDQAKVENDADMQYIMRYNKFQTDPLAHGNSCNQLACRADLANVVEGGDGVGGGGASQASNSKVSKLAGFGCIDAKYTSSAHVRAKRTIAISGPTHDDQPVFQWTKADPSVQDTPHLGQPDRFDFDWVVMTPDMNAAAPEWWIRHQKNQFHMWVATLGVVCFIAAASFLHVARKSYRGRCKASRADDSYHRIGNGKFAGWERSPLTSPGDLSTKAGSFFSPGAASSVCLVTDSP